MRVYLRTSKSSGVSMPVWLAVPVYLVWLVIVLAALCYASAAWVLVYVVSRARAQKTVC